MKVMALFLFQTLTIGVKNMDMYPKYKSPLGYANGDNKIDAYGVDHSGFSTRDELEYQFARQNKENQLIQNYNNQGITENYPQYTTNFWGSSPDNNYGFGTSKIHNNIENMQNQSNFGNSNNTQWGMNNEQPNNINSGYGQTNTYPQTYNIFGNNNALQNTPNLAQGLTLNASAALYPQQNSFNTYSQPYQLAQNTNPNMVSDVSNFVKANINFDDVYYSELGEDGNVIYQGTNKHEGGYSDRLNDLGGPTNYGVRQAALNEYNNWNSPLRTGFNFPIDVEKLTPKQAKQIMDEMYYQRYNINKLQNLKLARNTFDAEVNQGPYAGKMLANAMNEFYGYIPNQSEKFFYRNIRLNDNLANAVNNLTPEETIKVNDILAKLRMEKYFQSVDENPIQNVNNINGWYNRAKSYYSNPQEFERLYKHRVDDYIKNKYPQFYNGK